jgi:glutamate/tyrosine decarboxylase-like PLP-dependent enzyme
MSRDTAWRRVMEEVERFPREVRDLPVARPREPEALRRELERFDFRRPRPLDEVVGEVVGLLRDGLVHVTHPRYFGLFNPSVREAGVMADTLVALFNPQLAAWSHAPAANEIERHTLARLAERLGLPPATGACFTSGGAEANLSAVLAALAHHHPAASVDGLAALPRRPTVYVSADAHHSFGKVLRMTGLGTGALREVAVGPRLTLEPAALEERMAADAAAGEEPLLVVGTAGTTGAGAVDPLAALAAVARRRGAWFHVDAAWGGAAALSPRLAPVLDGIGEADSVTWDAHKWLSVPMGAGMFFCRHPAALERAFALATGYMPSRVEGAADPYATTVQWSRRFTGLKVFLSLAELGFDGYQELVERQAAAGDLLRRLLVDAGWRLVNDTPLPVVCFTHPDLEGGRPTVAEVAASVQARGRVWISEAVLGGRQRALRACITSYHTAEEDLAALVEEVETVRRGAA